MTSTLRIINADSETFARRLTELRESRGLSKKGLADGLQVSQGAITMWEDPEYGAIPSSTNLVKIARFFKTTVEQLCASDAANRRRARTR